MTARHRRGWRWLAALGAVALLAAACGGDGDDGDDATGAAAGGTEAEQAADGAGTEAAGDCEQPDEVRLQLKWVAQAQFAGYYAADEKGFYEDACLSVTILDGGPDVGPAQVVAGGGAEFGIDWLASTLAQRAAGEDFVNIAQVFQRSALMEVAWADSGISSIADLEGRRVGIWGFGNEYELLAALKQEGIDPEADLELVDQPFDMQLLLNREVDAAAATTYNEYAQLLEAENPETGELYQPDDFVTLTMDDAGTAMYQDGIFAKESYLADNEDIAARFVEASLRGWIHCRDNHDECVQITFDRGSVLGEGHQNWMMNEVNKLIWPSPEGVGIMVPEAYQRTAQIAADSIDVISEPPGDEAYRTDLVERALETIGADVTGEDWQPLEVEVTPGGE